MAALQAHIANAELESEHPARGDVVARYRRVRATATEIQQAAVNLVSNDAKLQCAKRLGVGPESLVEHPNIQNYIVDLLVHTAPAGRSRAIDRVARSTSYEAESEQSRIFEAMRIARFTIIQVDRRHEIAGVIGRDLISDRAVWIVDLAIEKRWPANMGLALRLYEPAEFHVATGVVVPMDSDVLHGMMVEGRRISATSPQALVEDRHFAEKLYRIALESGTLNRVELRTL